MRLSRLAAIVLLSLSSIAVFAGEVSKSGFDTEAVRMIGRFDLSVYGQARFTWPGSAIEFRFRGTAATIGVETEERIRFQVSVDGDSREFWATPEQSRYTLAEGLSDKVHQVRVTRLSESFSGVTAFTAGPMTDGELLASSEAPERKLLVLGDSITAGYGVEGANAECSYSLETSNPLKAYAHIAAAELDAEVHTIAWSGIGVWRGYGQKTPTDPTIRERRQLTLGADLESEWDHTSYRPDAVVIAIGTNDFWEGSATGYSAAMKKLIDGVQQDYPETPIYLTVSPMLTGEVRQMQKADLQSLVEEGVQLLDMGKIEPEDGYGCDYHPNVKTNQRMGEALAHQLRNDLNW